MAIQLVNGARAYLAATAAAAVLIMLAGVGPAAIAAEPPPELPSVKAPDDLAVFLTVGNYEVRQGAIGTIRIQNRADGKIADVAWPDDLEYFFVRNAGAQENTSSAEIPKPGADGKTIAVPLAKPGVAMLGVDRKATDETWPIERLTSLITLIDPSVQPPKEPATVRVRRYQSAKALVRVNDEEGKIVADGTAIGKSGQRVEIRTAMDPTLVRPGSQVAVRVYVDGASLPFRTVLATSPQGRTTTFRTNIDGLGYFKPTEPGVWALEFHSATASNDTGADWVVHSASVTFNVPKPQPKAAPPEGQIDPAAAAPVPAAEPSAPEPPK